MKTHPTFQNIYPVENWSIFSANLCCTERSNRIGKQITWQPIAKQASHCSKRTSAHWNHQNQNLCPYHSHTHNGPSHNPMVLLTENAKPVQILATDPWKNDHGAMMIWMSIVCGFIACWILFCSLGRFSVQRSGIFREEADQTQTSATRTRRQRHRSQSNSRSFRPRHRSMHSVFQWALVLILFKVFVCAFNPVQQSILVTGYDQWIMIDHISRYTGPKTLSSIYGSFLTPRPSIHPNLHSVLGHRFIWPTSRMLTRAT